MDELANILAIRLGVEQDMGGGVIDTGIRSLLSVRYIRTETQTFTLFGSSLYLMGYSVGQLDPDIAFSLFCKPFCNTPREYYQLSVPPPNPLIGSSRIYLIPQAPPPLPVATGFLTMLATGYDPLRGFFIQFQGNFDLVSTLFVNFPSTDRVIPDYQIKQT